MKHSLNFLNSGTVVKNKGHFWISACLSINISVYSIKVLFSLLCGHIYRYGPFMRYLTNHNVTGFYGFTWVSQVLSAIIASERCFCILQPLRSQRVLRTSTTTAIVIVVNVIVVGLYFLVVSRYRIACVYDPVRQISFMSGVTGRFYLSHQKLIDYLDAFVYGAGLPGVMMVVVTTMTIKTTIKLRQAAAWRAETSSSGSMTSQEIALTKMLVGNSVLFIVCVFPIAFFRLLSSPLPCYFVFLVESSCSHGCICPLCNCLACSLRKYPRFLSFVCVLFLHHIVLLYLRKFMCLVFTRMPGDSYHRRFRSLLLCPLCLCAICRSLLTPTSSFPCLSENIVGRQVWTFLRLNFLQTRYSFPSVPTENENGADCVLIRRDVKFCVHSKPRRICL